MSFILHGNYSKHPLKDNGTTLPICGQIRTVRQHLDTFAAHSAQHFNQNPTPQQCHEMTKPVILSTVNLIRSIKT